MASLSSLTFLKSHTAPLNLSLTLLNSLLAWGNGTKRFGLALLFFPLPYRTKSRQVLIGVIGKQNRRKLLASSIPLRNSSRMEELVVLKNGRNRWSKEVLVYGLSLSRSLTLDRTLLYNGALFRSLFLFKDQALVRRPLITQITCPILKGIVPGLILKNKNLIHQIGRNNDKTSY